jgi:hypothetical protein
MASDQTARLLIFVQAIWKTLWHLGRTAMARMHSLHQSGPSLRWDDGGFANSGGIAAQAAGRRFAIQNRSGCEDERGGFVF